jgi:predicted alpha/beta hydrolase family esterase
LNLLQHLPAQTKIKGAVMVCAFKDDLGWESLSELFDSSFDFEKIKKHCGKFTFLHSDDDPYISLEQPKYLASQTDGDLVVFNGQGHFNTDVGPQYQQFPEIMQFIEEIIKG